MTRRLQNERGATTTEVALIFVMALLFVFAFMQVALIGTVHSLVSYGAYIGARSSAVGHPTPDQAVQESLGRILSGTSPASTDADGGRARVSQDMTLFFPFINAFLGDRWRLSAEVALPPEPSLCCGDN